jgi:dihydroorotate dehydrogenase
MSLYDINKSFIDNWRIGPQIPSPLPIRQYPPPSNWHEWLGFKLMSRIGIPACPIMTSKGIALMSQLGFDVFTYKTIRSAEHISHPWPNIKYINISQPLTDTTLDQIVYSVDQMPASTEEIAITNSFGNNCLSQDEITQDIADAKRALQEGQILIVSIYGEQSEWRSQIEDFFVTAKFAKNSGADVIEANISCPNLHLQKRITQNNIFSDMKYFYQLVRAIVVAINPTPLLLKLGFISDDNLLQQILINAAKAGAAGITAINSIHMQVRNQFDNAVFGEQRQWSGVSGYPIKNLGLDFISRLQNINAKQKLDLSIIGVGGITKADHFTHYHNAGADIAMSATGTMWNPYLGVEYQNLATQHNSDK